MQPLVLKLGGNVVLDPAQVNLIATELKAVLAAGHEVTIVHGGGPQLDQAIAALGEAVTKVDGLRVTSPAAADVVLRVMDDIGAGLATQLRAQGLPATHLPARERAMHAVPKRLPNGDLQRVGTVTRFDGKAQHGHLLVVTPVGFDAVGPLNVNADEGACAVAIQQRARWLVLGTDVAAVRGADGSSLGRLTPSGAKKLIGNAATGGMIPKLHAAVGAIESGVGNVLITRIQPGTLTDAVLHGKATGTLVVPEALA